MVAFLTIVQKKVIIMPYILRLLRTWKLPVAMLCGVLLYFLFEAAIPETETKESCYYSISHFIQPALIFCMLFLSFLKVRPHDLRPHRWHGVLLLIQGLLFVIASLMAYFSQKYISDLWWALLFEGAMLCFICPTATASAVIVQKLGGSLSGVVTYIVLCNLMVSLLAPGFLTLVEPHDGMTFLTEFFMIMGKVFPLLLCPLFVALCVRHYTPHLMDYMLRIRDLAFYLWLFALAFAIMVTVRTIVETQIPVSILMAFAFVSMLCCCLQFYLGRRIGLRWQQPETLSDVSEEKSDGHKLLPSAERSAITAGQAFGQKNTVFIIWMGLVFLNPVTSVVGGFYSIWHNVINSWQLAKKSKERH